MTLDAFLSRLRRVRRSGTTASAECPSHSDGQENALSISKGDDGRILLHCFAGCPPEAVVAALGLTMQDLFPDGDGLRLGGGGRQPTVKGGTALHPPGLALADLAQAKGLPPDFLRSLGLGDMIYNGARAVRIPYFGVKGEPLAVRFRLSLEPPGRFVWRRGDKVACYGLDRLEAIREAGWVLLVEGESDCWTGWHHHLPVLGIPGKTTWRSVWRDYLDGLQIYLWEEPGAEDFSCRVATDVPGLLILPAPPGIKDLSDAHLQGRAVVGLVEQLKQQAIPAEDRQRERVEAHLSDLQERVSPILRARDPLALVTRALRRLGYGGDLTPALLTYLATTSRLLKMRSGTMPVHLLLVGVPSAGKSYTLKIVLLLLPPEAYHEIEAGSPRVLIYDEADLQHRVVIFSEADSLPAGEDNPAASAIRNLLQDHQLKYKVTVRDPESGGYRVREVAKPGPSVLITTAIKRLGPQLDSRLFTLDVPDDLDQIRLALDTQAALETQEAEAPDPALIAFQAYLQAQAPWDVVVPFASALSGAIRQSILAPRILRDFSRLLSLVKAVAILRHQHRQRDAKGRLIADIEDYATVYDLVKDLYVATTSGATERVRAVVNAVEILQGSENLVTVTRVAAHLGISKMTASRRVDVALGEGWLVNGALPGKGRAYDLKVGDPPPDPTGLPAPGILGECNGVTPLTDGIDPPPPAREPEGVGSFRSKPVEGPEWGEV